MTSDRLVKAIYFLCKIVIENEGGRISKDTMDEVKEWLSVNVWSGYSKSSEA